MTTVSRPVYLGLFSFLSAVFRSFQCSGLVHPLSNISFLSSSYFLCHVKHIAYLVSNWLLYSFILVVYPETLLNLKVILAFSVDSKKVFLNKWLWFLKTNCFTFPTWCRFLFPFLALLHWPELLRLVLVLTGRHSSSNHLFPPDIRGKGFSLSLLIRILATGFLDLPFIILRTFPSFPRLRVSVTNEYRTC